MAITVKSSPFGGNGASEFVAMGPEGEVGTGVSPEAAYEELINQGCSCSFNDVAFYAGIICESRTTIYTE